MRRIGLTGGIGSGKTTVSKAFAELGVPIIDADRIAHQLTQPGNPTCKLIREQFGDEFFSSGDELDRHKLRKIVFNDPEKLKQLESILHPRIRRNILQRLTELEQRNPPYCIVSIPLILESGMLNLVDRLIVVDLPEALQIQRVMQRDSVSVDHVRQILTQQADRDTRLKAADDVINNSGSPTETLEQVNNIDKILRQRK